MISGLIIYNQIDIERNQWFIDKCLKELNDELFSLELVEENDALAVVSNKKIDFVINRSRNHQLMRHFESLGVVCFNNSLTNEIANNKWKTYKLLKKSDIPCIESYDYIDNIKECPFVMKSLNGHGGQEVFLLNGKAEADKVLKKSQQKYIYQNYLENSGDLRVYLLGKRIIGAVLRQNDNDFRSNFSLGGSVIKYEPTQELINISLRIRDLLQSDFIGVDFLKTTNGFIVNEIEDPVGSRMLYQTSNINAISLLIAYIKDKMLHL